MKVVQKYSLIHHIGYVTVIKDLGNTKINSVDHLYLIINKVNGNIEKNSGDKYWTIVPTDESKDTLKKCEELWDKIRDLIKSVTRRIMMKYI